MGFLVLLILKQVEKPKKVGMVSLTILCKKQHTLVMWEERTGMPITNLVTIMDVDNDQSLLYYVEHRDNWVQLN